MRRKSENAKKVKGETMPMNENNGTRLFFTTSPFDFEFVNAVNLNGLEF